MRNIEFPKNLQENMSRIAVKRARKLLELNDKKEKGVKWAIILSIFLASSLLYCSNHLDNYVSYFFPKGDTISGIGRITRMCDFFFGMLLASSLFILYALVTFLKKNKGKYDEVKKSVIDSLCEPFCSHYHSQCDCKDDFVKFMELYHIDLY